MCARSRWPSTVRFKIAVMMITDPRSICHMLAVMYSCATNSNNVHNKSHIDGIIRTAMVRHDNSSRSFFSKNACCPIHMKIAGTIAENINNSIMMGLENGLTVTPSNPTDSVSYSILQNTAENVPATNPSPDG